MDGQVGGSAPNGRARDSCTGHVTLAREVCEPRIQRGAAVRVSVKRRSARELGGSLQLQTPSSADAVTHHVDWRRGQARGAVCEGSPRPGAADAFIINQGVSCLAQPRLLTTIAVRGALVVRAELTRARRWRAEVGGSAVEDGGAAESHEDGRESAAGHSRGPTRRVGAADARQTPGKRVQSQSSCVVCCLELTHVRWAVCRTDARVARDQGQCPEVDGEIIINDGRAVTAFGEWYQVEITDVSGHDLIGRVIEPLFPDDE
eukprot:2739757-Rhodomonas_salina.1